MYFPCYINCVLPSLKKISIYLRSVFTWAFSLLSFIVLLCLGCRPVLFQVMLLILKIWFEFDSITMVNGQLFQSIYNSLICSPWLDPWASDREGIPLIKRSWTSVMRPATLGDLGIYNYIGFSLLLKHKLWWLWIIQMYHLTVLKVWSSKWVSWGKIKVFFNRVVFFLESPGRIHFLAFFGF